MVRKARELLVLWVITILSGCAPIETVSTSDVMQSWVGENVGALFNEKGAPSQIMSYEDGYLLIYEYDIYYQTPSRTTTEATVISWGQWLSLQAKTTYYPGMTLNMSRTYAFFTDSKGTITKVAWNAPPRQLTEQGKQNLITDTLWWFLGIMVGAFIIAAIIQATVPQK